MNGKNLVAILLGAISLLAATSASAALVFVSRFDDVSLAFTDLNAFSDARFSVDLTHSLHADMAGDFGTYILTFGHPSVNVTFASSNNSSLAVTDLVTGPGGVTATLTSTDAVDQQVTAHFERLPNGPTITLGAVGGLNALEIVHSGSQSGSLSPYTYRLVMPGEWSSAGTSTGQHELLAVDNDWMIDQNFTFDGTKTTFAAHLDTYAPASGQEINLRFNLYGANAVPVPATSSLVAALLCLLGWSAHRIRHGKRFAGGDAHNFQPRRRPDPVFFGRPIAAAYCSKLTA